MSKNVKSQWDFGELFDPATTRRVFSVTELTARVRRALEKELGRVWVTGEVSNLRAQSSGHIYFTIKDGGAQLQCVLFRGEAVAHRELLQDGQRVVLEGDVTVYEPRGQYQLRVLAVELQGVGALQLAFERLKHKLQAEGLFAPERKRSLPKYPRRIGLVTSPTGAAIRDVLHVIQRRHPGLEIILAPCRVQGEGAGAEVARALRLLNEWSAVEAPGPEPAERSGQKLDLILVTRGGGSLEDLWAFNEEAVARAIFESKVPVVSAVGHEIDFTISDFVADVRAATPSAAAEIITEGVMASRRFVAEAPAYLSRLVRERLALAGEDLRQLADRLARVHPRRELQQQMQYLDDLQRSLLRCGRQGWRERQLVWHTLRQRLLRLKPSLILRQRRQQVQELQRRLAEFGRQAVRTSGHAVLTLEARLRLLSPENVLARGYSITLDAGSGRVVRGATEVRPGQRLKTRLQNGEIRSVVED